MRLLGPFWVETNLIPVVIRLRKARALLAYLAMKPDCQASREELAALLWGDNPDAQARHSLRQCLMSLRQDLHLAPDLLFIERDTIGLRREGLTVDAREFAAGARSTEYDELSRLAGLYRGVFGIDLDLDVEAFGAWRRHEGERTAEAAARVFASLARICDQAGDGDQAVAAAERLVALDPTREDHQRAALLLWARYRGREAAHGRAKAFTELLRRELDVAPQSETRALIEEIQRGVHDPATPAGQHAPLATARPAALGTPAGAPASVTTSPADRPEQQSPAASRRWNRRPVAAVGAAIVTAVLVMLGVLQFAPGWLARPLASRTAANGEPPLAPSVADALAKAAVIPVVVLPFDIESPHGTEDQSFAQSLTHDLIGYLARYYQLRVVSDETSDLYRRRPLDIAQIGADLGVPYAIIGRVQVDDTGLRVAFQIVDTASRLDIWSNQVQRARTDMAVVADEIARGIARALVVQITYADARRRSSSPDPSSGIADLVTRARAAEQLGPWRENLSASRQLFDEALRRDPHFLPAMLGVARVAVMARGNFVELDPPVDLEQAEHLLDEALARSPDSASAHYISAQLQKIQGHYAASIQSFQRALELNPSLIFAHAHIGNMMTRLGQPQEGLEQIRNYMRMAAPNEPAMGYGYLFAGEAELALGHTQAAIEWMLRANAFFPGSPRFQASLAGVYAILGDTPNAAKFAAAFRRLSPDEARRIANTAPQNLPIKEGSRPSTIWDGLRIALAEKRD
ncbi:MAG TPA: BTAD domain-containing putative transcriptional regulator [Xanthobacteraceae bacterium]